MSRRDTIIIALLVNAGLLALLFMLAVNTHDEVVLDQPEINKTIAESRPAGLPAYRPQTPIILVDTHVNDEVDSFLKDLAAEGQGQTLLIDDEGYATIQPEAPPIATPKQPVQYVKKNIQPDDDANYVEVTVKRGDALEKIARSNGTTVEAIKKANQLSSAKLSIGQVLRIPLSGRLARTPEKSTQIPVVSQALKEPEKTVITTSDVQYYTLKSGDNPWKIAKQFNVKFEDLLRLNNLDEERARNLKVGDKVRVK